MSDSVLIEMRLSEEGDCGPGSAGRSAADHSDILQAGQDSRTVALPASGDTFIDLLVAASQELARDAVTAVAARMRAHGIEPEDIADIYIPAAARRMGDMWNDDDMGFAAVTAGCARLHVLLRELGPDWRADRAGTADGPAVLVLVANDISHTLGATVMAGQLRRLGLSVRLLVGARPQEVGAIMHQARYDAVLISASMGERLESLRRLVKAVNGATMTPPPVVLGGTFTLAPDHDPDRVKAITGADHVSNDLMDALDKCGLVYASEACPRQMRKA